MQQIIIMLLDSNKDTIIDLQNNLKSLLEDRLDLTEETLVKFLVPESYHQAHLLVKRYKVDFILLENKVILDDPDNACLKFIKQIRREYLLRYVPLVILSQEYDEKIVVELLDMGVTDFFTKPLSVISSFKIRNIIDSSVQYRNMRNKMMALSSGMDGAVEIVKEREREIIFRLARAAATRDKETGNHIYRVGQYSVELSKTLGLSYYTQEILEKAAPLHDVGKIAIPDAILQKPGKLTNDEYKVMKNHTIYGYKILYNPDMDLLRIAADIALSHHERWDGKGYPFGRSGEDIILEARITTVADIFDAFTSRRRYKEAWSLEETYKELLNESGTALDPRIVEALMDTRVRFEEIREMLKDDEGTHHPK